jgi:hypothetical protein
MKTYTIEELNATNKTRLDYETEHRKMLENMKPVQPEEKAIWEIPGKKNLFWTTGNIMNPDGTRQEGAGLVPKIENPGDS